MKCDFLFSDKECILQEFLTDNWHCLGLLIFSLLSCLHHIWTLQETQLLPIKGAETALGVPPGLSFYFALSYTELHWASGVIQYCNLNMD